MTRGQLDFLWSTIVAIFLVGGTIGSLGGSYFADKVGRKGALIVSSFVGLIAGILFFTSKSANSVELLILGRLLVGVSSGTNDVANLKTIQRILCLSRFNY